MADEIVPAAAVEVAGIGDLRRFLGALHELWRRDPEAGHSWDGHIRVRVLQMCAAGHPDSAALAREVLVTSTWDDVERWLAVFPEDEISDDEGEEPVEVRFAAGRRVRFAHPGAGYPGEAEDAARRLTPGGVYTIAWADIGQSRTDLNLAAGGKPAGRFNSVFFEPADDQEAAVKAGEKE